MLTKDYITNSLPEGSGLFGADFAGAVAVRGRN